MDREKKLQVVEKIKKELASSSAMVVIHYQGLSVEDLDSIRGGIRSESKASGSKICVTKNTLAKIALQGLPYEKIANHLKGPVALLFTNDPVAAVKVIVKFQKNNERLKILAGVIDNTIIDNNEVKALSTLPSLDGLRGQIVSVISSSASQLINIIGNPAFSLTRVLQEFANKE